ncbi:hypothetical protein ACQY0O_002112 [Thecaphora frezii]
MTHHLLHRALPSIPLHGFTTSSLLHANPNLTASTLSRLFPGPDTAATSAPRQLFAAWDRSALDSMVAHLDAEEGERGAFQTVVKALQERLERSADVHFHLVGALANETSHPLPKLPFGLALPITHLPLPQALRSRSVS